MTTIGQPTCQESTTLRLWLWKTLRNRLSDPTLDELSQRATRVSSQERREPDRGLDRALDGRPHRRRRRRHMRTECRRNQLAPLRDAQTRAIAACASVTPARKGRTAWSALILLNAARVSIKNKESPTGEDRALGYERARRCGAPSHFGLGCPTPGPSQHLDSRHPRQGLDGLDAVDLSQRLRPLIIRARAARARGPAQTPP